MKQPDTEHTGQLVNYCSHLFRCYLDRETRRYDLTPVQSRAILFLHCHPGAKQRQLETLLHVKPSTVNGIVERLEQKQMLTRRTDPADGRCRTLFLTEKGEEHVHTMGRLIAEMEQKSRRGFSPEEETQLYGYLQRMIENLKGEEEC